MYSYLLLMYKLKGFILSVTVVSLLDFNNTGLGGPTVCGLAHWTLSLAWAGPFSFIKIWARPSLGPAWPGPQAACPVQGSVAPAEQLTLQLVVTMTYPLCHVYFRTVDFSSDTLLLPQIALAVLAKAFSGDTPLV